MVKKTPVLWDDPDEIKHLLRDRTLVKTVAEYTTCTQDLVREALTARAAAHGGYSTFQILKSDGVSRRTINNPHEALKEVQAALLPVLRQTPLSRAVCGAEPGTNIKKNVHPHITNPWTIAMDLKNAFPSASAQRVADGLHATIEAHLDLSWPNLADAERKRFSQAIVTLVTKGNQLPQGSPTSAFLLNMAMRSADRGLLGYLRGDAEVENPQYTRYIDDMTFSWRSFKQVTKLMKMMNEVLATAMHVQEHVAGKTDHDTFMRAVLALGEGLSKLSTMTMTPHSGVEQEKLRKKLFEVKAALVQIRNRAMETDSRTPFDICYGYVGEIDRLILQLNVTPVEAIMQKFAGIITKILQDNDWSVHEKKTQIWHAGSSTCREITGIAIGHDGRLGIPSRTIDRYVRFATMCAEHPEELPKLFKNPDGSPNPEAIGWTLQGFRNFIADVKENIPTTFEAPYRKARQRFFAGWRAKRYGYTYSDVHGGTPA